MEYSKDEKSHVDPSWEKILSPSRSLPTDINKDNRHDPANIGSLPEHAGFTYFDSRPQRECRMTDKGLTYWMENREQRRKNQSYYSEIIDSYIIRIQSLMVSTENIDNVKDCLNKVLRTYQDFSRQFDNEGDKLNDPAYLRVCSDVRDVELRVTKWLQDFNTGKETVSNSSKSSRGSIRSKKSNRSRLSGAPSSTLDDVIRNRAKIAELKAKSEYLEREKKAEAELDRTRLEKELAVAQAADKVHREFLEDSYVLNPSKILENTGFSDNKIRMKTEAHMDCAEKEDRFFDKQTNVLDAKTPSFVPKFIPSVRPQLIQRYITTPNPPTSQHAHAMFAAPDPQAVEPTSRNIAQTENRVSNEENMEAIKMLYQLMAKQGEYLHRQGAPEPKLEKFGGNPMKYQYFINMFETVVEARVKDPRDRLVLLIEHTYGEAKCIIETCLYLEASAAYERAKSLLQETTEILSRL